MDIVTICIIVFFLVFMIIGYIKGFLGILLTVCKGLASIIISYFLCKPFGDFLFNLGLGNAFVGKIETSITQMTGVAGEIINAENYTTIVSGALTEMKIPDFLHGIILGLVGKFDFSTANGTLAHYIATALATIACTVIAFLVLILLLNLFVLIFRRIFRGVNRIPLFGKLNRILGLVLNFLYAWFIISVFFWAVALISTFIPGVGNFVNGLLKLDQENMSIAKWLYEHNLATYIYKFFIK